MRIVLKSIFTVFGAEIARGELPDYQNLVRKRALFSANLSFKNLSGDQMLLIFTKKLVRDEETFKKLVYFALDADSDSSFETKLRNLLGQQA